MKKILFIEDEPTLQKTVSQFLENEGYEIKSAIDGKLGVKAAGEFRPDLILLDLILPKMNGFEVLKELKENASTKNIPVIVLTNLEGSADVEKAISLGAKNYLVKANYELGEIAKKIKETLNY
ncbi:MAG: response regulator [Patescibacteria group bacterium]|nr:response regulator [Patescibacteria group bacterium]